MARKHGLQTNRLTAIEIVTADGELRRVDAASEPELFWALRGGGGNFGVVTAIEFELIPVREFYAGTLFFPYERAAEVLHAWREWIEDAARGDHVGRPHAAASRPRADPRDRARQVVRDRRGGLPRHRGRGRRAARAAARARARDGHVRDGAAGRRSPHLHMDPIDPVPYRSDPRAARRPRRAGDRRVRCRSPAPARARRSRSSSATWAARSSRGAAEHGALDTLPRRVHDVRRSAASSTRRRPGARGRARPRRRRPSPPTTSAATPTSPRSEHDRRGDVPARARSSGCGGSRPTTTRRDSSEPTTRSRTERRAARLAARARRDRVSAVPDMRPLRFR